MYVIRFLELIFDMDPDYQLVVDRLMECVQNNMDIVDEYSYVSGLHPVTTPSLDMVFLLLLSTL